MTKHRITDDGESNETWALCRHGFVGSIDQFTCCARCGEALKAQPYNHPRHYSMKPVPHFLCEDCFEALP